MIKEIKYKGFTATPSDYECPDGDLSVAINLVPEEGALKAIRQGVVIGTLDSGDELMYIHVVDDNIKNYIIRNGLSLYYRQEGKTTKTLIYTFDTNGFKCSSNGNVLCVYGAGECIHFLYSEGSYTVFASGDMNVGILFGLQGELAQANNYILNVVVNNGATMGERFEHYADVSVHLASDRSGTVETPVYIPAGTYKISVRNDSGELRYDEHFYVGLKNSGTDNGVMLKSSGMLAGEVVRVDVSFDCDRLRVNAGVPAGIGAYSMIYGNYDLTVIIDRLTGYIEEGGAGNSLSDNSDALTGVMGVANSLVNNIHSSNKFVFPFFVRYGFRLLSGEIITVSAPILMEPNTRGVPEICINQIGPIKQDVAGGYKDANVAAYAYSCKLQYKVRDKEKLRSLMAQKKVSSLVIAVSSPLYLYKQGATNNEIRNSIVTDNSQSLNRCYAIDGVHDFTISGYNLYITLPDNGVVDNYESRLASSLGVFRIVKEIDVDEISMTDSFVDVPLDAGVISGLNGITSTLDGRALNLSTYDYKYVVSYNMREHASGVSENTFAGYDLDCMSGYVGRGSSIATNTSVVRTKGDTNVVVYRGQRTESSLNRRWFFFPDNISGSAKVYEGSNEYTIGLTECDSITGVYHFGGLGAPKIVDGSLVGTPKTNFVKSFDNTMYVSKVADPTVREQSLRIGDGVILAVAASTKPISRGQMGQAPLFVYATDGIWALELMQDGKYLSRQALSRDVCTNISSITNIDDGLLFVCGDMIRVLGTSDNSPICISDDICSYDVFTVSLLPNLGNIDEDVISVADEFISFREFIADARVLYDYIHQRIIVYNPSCGYAYVYSLKSKKWGMMESDIQYTVNSYPGTWAVNSRNEIVSLSLEADAVQEADVVEDNGNEIGSEAPELIIFADDFEESDEGVGNTEGETPTEGGSSEGETPSEGGSQEGAGENVVETESQSVKGLLVTRPIKLDAPDILKTVDTIIQRGYFRKGHVKTILYGSRDLFNWHLIYSSNDHYLRGFRGTPYKYFRIVLLCELSKEESIDGCTVQFTPRLLDQPR